MSQNKMIDYTDKDKLLLPGDAEEQHQEAQGTGIRQPQQLGFILITGINK